MKPAGQAASKCYNCNKPDHLGRNCPDKEKGPQCYRCHKFDHLASRCPEPSEGTTAKKPNAQVNVAAVPGRSRGNQNWKSVEIASTRVTALVDSGSDYNLLREDALKASGEKERLRGAGGPISTQGKVVLATKIDGAEYTLEYRVVPRANILEKVILGEDLQNHAIIQLGAGQPSIFPAEAYMMQIQAENKMQLPSLDYLESGQAAEVKQLVSNYQPTG